MPTVEDLQILQALPLEIKIEKTKQRIREWIEYWGIDGVYLSWSGGKDSTVLKHIIEEEYPNIMCLYINVGLEYPEVIRFIQKEKRKNSNIVVINPKQSFNSILYEYGYPVLSKEIAKTVEEARKYLETGKYESSYKKLIGTRLDKYGNISSFNIPKHQRLLQTDFLISDKCCKINKKSPARSFERKTKRLPILGTMTCESAQRKTAYLKRGCNAFDVYYPSSQPMAFWTEQDVLRYIYIYNVEIPSVYGSIIEENGIYKCTGVERCGCVGCPFGAQYDKDNSRYLKLYKTHPRLYNYCINGGEYDSDGLWKPNKQGLGMGHVFDKLNELYGEEYIKYKPDDDNSK